MTRIAAVTGRVGAREPRLKSMLAGFSGELTEWEGANSQVGVSIQGPGGLAEKAGYTLAMDGLLYGDAVDVQQRDADVALSGILEWGPEEYLKGANGDFALVLLDSRSSTLTLARDAFGMRPLYYARIDDGWAVCSQPRGLLNSGLVAPDRDEAFALRFGAMHYRLIDIEPVGSPYRDVRQVPAATLVRLHPDGQVDSKRYWHLPSEPDRLGTEGDLAEQYRDLIFRAVDRRVRRYPQRAFTLSGGMDSSTVLATATSLDGLPQDALSGVYDDPTYDERTEIADMLSLHVGKWNPVELGSRIDVIDEVDQLVRIHDEPVATATWLSHRYICQVASELGFTSLFGGLGGDELNAGEYEYFPYYFADLLQAGRDQDFENEVTAWSRLHDHPIYRKHRDAAVQAVRSLTDPGHPGRCLPDMTRMTKYARALRADVDGWRTVQPVMEEPFDSYLKNRTWQDLTRETIPCCLRAEDRHGEAFGTPPVLPFLDRDLVAFMYSVPETLKIRGGVTKVLLREAMKGVLPEATRTRVKKTGWNAPAHLWFTGNGAEAVRDLTDSDEFRALGLFDKTAVRQIIDEHERIVLGNLVEENHMMFLWQFVNLLRWEKLRQDQWSGS